MRHKAPLATEVLEPYVWASTSSLQAVDALRPREVAMAAVQGPPALMGRLAMATTNEIFQVTLLSAWSDLWS